jgi:hypothetical protein
MVEDGGIKLNLILIVEYETQRNKLPSKSIEELLLNRSYFLFVEKTTGCYLGG